MAKLKKPCCSSWSSWSLVVGVAGTRRAVAKDVVWVAVVSFWGAFFVLIFSGGQISCFVWGGGAMLWTKCGQSVCVVGGGGGEEMWWLS